MLAQKYVLMRKSGRLLLLKWTKSRRCINFDHAVPLIRDNGPWAILKKTPRPTQPPAAFLRVGKQMHCRRFAWPTDAV
jgi:hypothetical protein